MVAKKGVKRNLLSNKKGKSNFWRNFLVFGILILFIVGGVYVFTGFEFNESKLENVNLVPTADVFLQRFVDCDVSTPDCQNTASYRFASFSGNTFSFLIGDVPDLKVVRTGDEFATIFSNPKGVSLFGTFIVLLCIWIMVALVFGDVLRNFSAISASLAFPIGFLFAIAAANLGVLADFVTIATQWFAMFGVVAIYIALGLSFIAFIAVESGLKFFAPWVMRRKGMQIAAKNKNHTKKNVEELKTVISGLRDVGKTLGENK